MLQVAVIGMTAAFLAIAVPKERKEFSMLVVLMGCLLIFALSYQKMTGVMKIVRKLQQIIGRKNTIYIDVLLKIIGITYIAELSADVCQDAGYAALSKQIIFYGKIFVLAVSMPILVALLETIENYLK